ncbi:cytochrome P450 [soil metagenome]
MKHPPLIDISLWTLKKQGLQNPIDLRTRIFKKYGDIACKKFFGKYNYYMGHPLYAQHVFDKNQDNYINKHALITEVLSPFIGVNGLFTSNNIKQWDSDRLLAMASFDPKVYFKNYATDIVSLSDQTVGYWQKTFADNQTINIATEIDKLVINIVLNTLFTHMDLINVPELAAQIPAMTETIKAQLQYLCKPLWKISPQYHQYKDVLSYIRNLSCNIVRDRMENNKAWDDMLGNFLQQYRHLDKNEAIQYVSYHLTTFFAVGYFTTASLIHWLVVVLSLHPTVEREIQQELDCVIGSRLPCYEDVRALPYLSSVVKETLRLHPTSFAVMRQNNAEDEINGFYIHKNSGIIMSIYHIHRHPDFWTNPEGFDPYRFMNNPIGQEERFAYIPFALGKRSCIGSAFSTMEAILIMATILQRYRIFLPSNTKIHPRITTLVTMRPDVDMMILSRR